MKYEEFFRKHPVFTVVELDSHLFEKGTVGSRARESLLSYHRKKGHVVLIRRGLYAVIPPGAVSKLYPVDPFLIATKVTGGAVLSYHSALEMHGYAYSVREHITYSAPCPVSTFSFRSHVFRGVKFPKALNGTGRTDFGVSDIDRQGLDVPVTNLERTFVDMMDRPALSGGWEEIWRSLESVEFFDLDSVVEYALLLNNATTIAKVGFFLDQHRELFMVEPTHLNALREHCPKQPHYLDASSRRSGKLAADWNLVLPVELFERSWAEVL